MHETDLFLAEIAAFLVPLRMRGVCLTPPREHRAVPAPLFSQEPVTAASLGSVRPRAGGAGVWRWHLVAIPSSTCSGAATSLGETQPGQAARIQGWRREAGVLSASLPAQLTRTFGPFSGLEGKRHRETGQFQANFFSLPLSHCPTLAALLNCSPWHLQAVKLHTAAERRAGIKLVTHLHPRVTQLKLCLYTPKLARSKFIWTLPAIPSLQFRECGGCGSFSFCSSLLEQRRPPPSQRQQKDWFIKPDSLRQSARRLSCWWGVLMLSAAHMSIGQLLPVQSPLWEKFRARFGGIYIRANSTI